MNYKNVILYKTVMALMRELLEGEQLTKEEYGKISAILAEKSGLESCSIFVDILQDIE